MAVKTLPLDYDIVVYSGTNYRREFRWLPDGIVPQDFTGWSARMLIGQPGSPAVLKLSPGAGLTLSSGGQIIVDMTPAMTAALQPGLIFYNLDMIEPGLFIRRFIRGRVSVVQDVREPLP